MKFCIVLGTRPEIIKLCPVIREFERGKEDYFILHTGQHYSKDMNELFFQELKLPPPLYNLGIGSGSHGKQTGVMLERIEEVLVKEKPNAVIVLGDTNTCLAGSLAAKKLHINVVHLEAGLRSYDTVMAEEINRVVIDHISDILFTPTEKSREILLGEGIPDKKIVVSGNTIVDSIIQNMELSNNSILDELGLEKKKYILVTLHRPETVDYHEKLSEIIESLNIVKEELQLPIIFPIHPRTMNKIKEFDIKIPEGIKTIKPCGYLEFLALEKNARIILTDSGGIQEESCIIKVPCVTLRDNTERPETVEVGANVIAGTKKESIIKNMRLMLKREEKWRNPFGEGNSAKIIVDYLKENKIGE